LCVSVDRPTWGQERVARALAERGVIVSATGVRGVWRRHDLVTMRRRLAALARLLPAPRLAAVHAELRRTVCRRGVLLRRW